MHYQDKEILDKIEFFLLNEAEEELLEHLSQDFFGEANKEPEELFNYINDNYEESDIVLFSGLYLSFDLTYDEEEELYLVD